MQALEMQATTAETGPGEYVVATSGEVDLHSAPALEQILDRLLAGGALGIVLDLRSASFFDSTGLGVVTRASKRLRDKGGLLVLTSDSHDILSVFRVTGLDRLLTIRPTLSASLDLLRERAR